MPRKAMIGKMAEEVFPKKRPTSSTSTTSELLSSGEPQFYDEHPVTTPERRHAASSTTTRMPIRDASGSTQYLLTVVDDRTHRKRAEAQIARLVHHDLLTGLPNRAAFTACIDATIETAAKDGSSFALMCLDFDRFKEVNDVYGHAAGDELLRQIVEAPAGRRRRRVPGPARRRRIRRDRHRRRAARRGRGHGGPAARRGQRRDRHRTAIRCAPASASASRSSRSTAPTPPR